MASQSNIAEVKLRSRKQTSMHQSWSSDRHSEYILSRTCVYIPLAKSRTTETRGGCGGKTANGEKDRREKEAALKENNNKQTNKQTEHKEEKRENSRNRANEKELRKKITLNYIIIKITLISY